MKIKNLYQNGFEEVVYFEEPRVSLQAIIAIHSLVLGPACGGIRLYPYTTFDEALTDVLRLAQGMTYKSALSDLAFGGAKSVIILDPSKKTKELFYAFADAINTLHGRYISAKDLNITADDLRFVKERSRYVLGIEGEVGSSGEPSLVTARGVLRGMEATLLELSHNNAPTITAATIPLDLYQGKKIVIQGAGHVGSIVCEELLQKGAKVYLFDINQEKLKKFSQYPSFYPIKREDEIFTIPCDIFSPCARGAVLNKINIPKLLCKGIVGCANNQLDTEDDGWLLHKRGILYAPDYVVNAGGIINVYDEFIGYNKERALRRTDLIFDTVRDIFKISKKENLPTSQVADNIAIKKIQMISDSKKKNKIS